MLLLPTQFLGVVAVLPFLGSRSPFFFSTFGSCRCRWLVAVRCFHGLGLRCFKVDQDEHYPGSRGHRRTSWRCHGGAARLTWMGGGDGDVDIRGFSGFPFKGK